MQTSWGPEFVTDPTAESEVHAVDEEMAREADAEADVPPPPPAPDRGTLTKALRELEAAKGRVERDATRARDEMKQQLVHQLLPVLDNLDRTITAAQKNREAPTIVEGAYLVRRQIVGVLEGYGVQRIDARGQRFDPALHEAISMVHVDEPRHDRTVIDQLEPGYAMGERLLRPAKVVVGRVRYH
jgi:molecular chaperone GrpE (heat shock protein)